MEKRILLLLFLLWLLPSCKDGIDESLLVGKWQAVELTEAESVLDLDLSPVYFEFFENERYHFQSTLKFFESGRYYTTGHYLYTTDTTATQALEKAVKITLLSKDSLSFLMNDQGIQKHLKLTRISPEE